MSDRTVRDLTRLLTQMETRIKALEQGSRTSQLQNASITGTAITVYDEDGETRRGSIGIQADGTIGFVAEGGPAPSATTAPIVTPSIAGLKVVWDGLFADGSDRPADFDHVAVHVSTTSGFVPSAATFAGTITVAGNGGVLPVAPLPYVTHYVQLVGVNTSAVAGPASAEASGTPIKVDGPDLTAGSVTAGAIAAGAVTADKLEAVLSIANRIVAGNPAGARVELNSTGLRVYDSAGVETVQLDAATGGAVFSGNVDGATITGGTVTTDSTGTNVKIYTSPSAGVVAFPTGSSVEGAASQVLSGRVNTGLANEYLALDINSPKCAAPADGYVQIQLNSQNADGSSSPNLAFMSNSGQLGTWDAGKLRVNTASEFINTVTMDNTVNSVVSSPTSWSLACKVSGDAYQRFTAQSGGTLSWGDGANQIDVQLLRSSANHLRVTGALNVDSQLYAGSYGYDWAAGTGLLTMAAGWTLNTSYGIKVGGTIHVMAAVQRTTALTADAGGNVGDETIFTLVSGWRPNSNYGSARLPYAASTGYADGAVMLDSDVGTLKIVAWEAGQTIATTHTLNLHLTFPA